MSGQLQAAAALVPGNQPFLLRSACLTDGVDLLEKRHVCILLAQGTVFLGRRTLTRQPLLKTIITTVELKLLVQHVAFQSTSSGAEGGTPVWASLQGTVTYSCYSFPPSIT